MMYINCSNNDKEDPEDSKEIYESSEKYVGNYAEGFDEE